MTLRTTIAAWLHNLADDVTPPPSSPDPYACEMCGVIGTGGCSICGSGGCDNGCRSPQSSACLDSEDAVGEEKRCPGCGAHPTVWTWYGGVALGTVGPPRTPRRARRGWRERVRNEVIRGPIA